MADSDVDMEVIGKDDLDDIGPAFVNVSIPMKRFEKVLDEVSIMYNLADKSKDHMNTLKRNFWLLICTRVGLYIHERESTIHTIDKWMMCYNRFNSIREDITVETSAEFIFNNFPEKYYPLEIQQDLDNRVFMTYTPR